MSASERVLQIDMGFLILRLRFWRRTAFPAAVWFQGGFAAGWPRARLHSAAVNVDERRLWFGCNSSHN